MANTARVAAGDVEALAAAFANSRWDRVEVTINGWELRLGRVTWPVPGLAAEVSVTVGAADVGRCVPVVAPHLATVRLAPAPGVAKYVELGDRVDTDTPLCGLDVLRGRSELRAGVAGIVRRISAADGALVEAGQPLFFVESQGKAV